MQSFFDSVSWCLNLGAQGRGMNQEISQLGTGVSTLRSNIWQQFRKECCDISMTLQTNQRYASILLLNKRPLRKHVLIHIVLSFYSGEMPNTSASITRPQVTAQKSQTVLRHLCYDSCGIRKNIPLTETSFLTLKHRESLKSTLL